MLIYTQACGVALLSVLLVMYFMKRSKIFLNTEKFFITVLITSLIANVIDIICQIMLANPTVPYTLTKVFCEAYQISVLLVLCCTMLYISRDIYENTGSFWMSTWYYLAIWIASAVTIFILPEELSFEPGKLYAYGTSVTVSYVIAAFYIVAVLVRVNVRRAKVNSDRRAAINIWMVLWFAVAVLESVFPSVFMAGFATSIGVMIIYIKLENPGMNMDRQSGLYNQNAFMEYIHQLYCSHRNFAMVIIVPVSYGDSLYNHTLDMKRVTQILKADKALLFRKSEDEIALVFDDYEDAKEWETKYSEFACRSVDPEITALRNGLWINISDSRLFIDLEELMYFVKYAVANRHDNADSIERKFINVNEETVSAMREEIQIGKMIDEALMENRVEVFYQPIFSTEKQFFTSAEALVRIRSKDGRIIPPGVFIPVAERSGKIIELGNEVFRQVCQIVKEDNIAQYGIEYVEVNLSVVQCGDSSLADNYIAAMEEYEVNPKCINLEITESASLKSKEILLENMNQLIEYGVNFSLDDFGTGQSNLNYIVDMPVDIVKFDRDMINAYFANKKARYVMDAAMHMIHGMGLKIVSEGIETNEQFGRMKDLGISFIQGFYFSKPLEKKDFIQFLIDNNKGAANV